MKNVYLKHEHIMSWKYIFAKTEHWKIPLNCQICDHKDFNKLDLDSHIHFFMCQEDFKDIDNLEQHNLFEE